jgi:hypothetical protein
MLIAGGDLPSIHIGHRSPRLAALVALRDEETLLAEQKEELFTAFGFKHVQEIEFSGDSRWHGA